MKPTLVTTLCFLLFSFTIYFPLPFTHANKIIVKDIFGNPVVPSGSYYIWPDYLINGGELRLGETENSTCPFTVLQDYSNLGPGLPVKFTPQNQTSSDDPITLMLPIEITFENKPDCAESSKWLVVEAENEYPTPWVTIDGTNKNVYDGYFMIVGFKKTGYLIFFCHKLLSPTPGVCIYLSRRNDENGMRLVYEMDGDALGAVFVNVNDAARARRSSVLKKDHAFRLPMI
ncbi:putative proteinase inhibitor I3, Kunitz legume [Medicago truncatula]|uniref:Kunitz type trypsin inhibitor / Alpha-fucosidase n=1 Tax=Medicago truncatula TaxID=3880 RepID=G7KJK1_MEDTR|nr:kunitz-type trypsin inhibitor-like 2 protein [Medicago truncatula]AES75434.2 Kunitz type trypsin inhibitor / Alpha-fucosidase [Medicago truncatula]RHN51350.1 putative proteinase inhibitor I3, Kunitz legume [Medicago truncatula]